MKKRLVTLLLVLIMAVCSVPALNTPVQVYATSKTANDAITWVKSNLGKGLDYDNQYGCQCVDFIMYYYKMLGVNPASGNGKDYGSNTLPSGWSRVKGGTPHKGDILVYGPSNTNKYGHVAIYESDKVTYHQNYNGKQYVQKVTNIKYNGFTNPYWGCIRPNWSNSKVTIVYNVNGGAQKIASEYVSFGSTFYTPKASSTYRVGYTLAGFNGYRYKDDSYYANGKGWVPASKISNYTKALYKLGSSHKMSAAWIYDGDFISYNKLRFDAVWTGTKHTISYNGNGAKGTAPKTTTVVTGKKFTIASKGNLTKKYLAVLNYKFQGWTVVRNSDKKYYSQSGKWYPNDSEHLKKYPARIYKAGEQYTLGAAAWLGTSKSNTNASFTFKAVWKK